MVHSLITLFPPTATTFDTNGLGSLGEAISCVVTEERNGAFELEMVYPVTGKHYNDITNRSILYVKPNPIDPPQAFRIYSYTKPMDGSVTYQAEHISYDLSGYAVNAFTANSCAQALDFLKTGSVIQHPFSFWTDISSSGAIDIKTPCSIRSALGGMEGSILDTYGGEYKFDNFMVRLYSHRGADRGVVIRYGKNLVDLKQEENMSNVYTDVLPYWYGQIDEQDTLITISNLLISTESSYDFRRILVLDTSSNITAENPDPGDVYNAGVTWIKNNNPSVPSTSFDVSFAQLEQIEEYNDFSLLEHVELCDEVTVEYPKFGVSAKSKVTKTVYDVLTQSYTSVTLGDIRATISGTVSGQDSNLENATGSLRNEFNKNLSKTKSELEKATENATNWITNGKGYMVAIKNDQDQWSEICSLDNPDLTKAINVWRWNSGGFGHSSRGYTGPYDIAITQDGYIVADFITTGTLSGVIIKSEYNPQGPGNSTTISNGEIVFEKIDESGLHYRYGRIHAARSYTIKNPWYENPELVEVDATIYECGNQNVLELRAGEKPIIQIYPMDYKLDFTEASHDTTFMDCDVYINYALRANDSISSSYSIYAPIVWGENFSELFPTSNYASRSLPIYSMTSSIIGDIGEAQTDENGECYVSLNDIFLETISDISEYQVFLQKEGPGDIWVSEKGYNYFVVKGTENLKFAWEIKAKRKDTETLYMERSDTEPTEEIDYEREYSLETLKLLKEKNYEETYSVEINELLKNREEGLYQ